MSDGERVERVESGTFERDNYTYTRTTDRGSYVQEETGTITSDLIS